MKRTAYNRRKMLAALATTFALLTGTATYADTRTPQKSSPVPVTFGIRSLTPDTPVNPQVAFVSQSVTLPDVVCNACTDQDSWSREWTVSQMTLDRDNTHADRGWYVFYSGVKGIDISVQVTSQTRKTRSGSGMKLKEDGELIVGLVRTGRDTGAGLADLPATEFIRTTTFTGKNGEIKYIQQDSIRVSADLRVPTCTTTAGSLNFQLPEISQVWLRHNVERGGYTNESASLPQVVVANCSENTRHLRIRFFPQGNTTDSQQGTSTILTGRDENGQETGIGFLMKYNASAFGHNQQGVVFWDPNHPLDLENTSASASGGELTQGITVALQVFYARPLNEKAITAGEVSAKGLYQVSYE